MAPPQSILITGASSGIGRALALAYAAPGIHLALGGRDAARLDETAAQCAAAGAAVATRLLDVRAHGEMADWVRETDMAHPIDLAVACAGITGGVGFGRLRETPAAARAVIDVNLLGTINTLAPAVERMCMRGRGHVALFGSLAGFRGLPYCPAYSASKAAVHCYAEALRGMLRRHRIRVTLIAPGFVATPLEDSIVCPKPLLMTAERAVRIICRGLDRGAATIVFPRSLYYGQQLLRLLPRRLYDLALTRIAVDVPEQIAGERD